MHASLNINSYIGDGFQKVCSVTSDNSVDNKWFYTDINPDLMFADHRSWIYFIVVDEEVWKVGETGNPLGIRPKNPAATQPLTGTRGRLGRYRSGDYRVGTYGDTDWDIRVRLSSVIADGGNVEFWARQCPVDKVEVTVGGKPFTVGGAYHKELEMAHLDYIFNSVDELPTLNKFRK